MATLTITEGFNVRSRDPIDSRFVHNGRPWTNTNVVAVPGNSATHIAYEGLVAVDTSDDTLWMLTDTTNAANSAGWTQQSGNTIVANPTTDLDEDLTAVSIGADNYNIRDTRAAHLSAGANTAITGRVSAPLTFTNGVSNRTSLDIRDYPGAVNIIVGTTISAPASIAGAEVTFASTIGNFREFELSLPGVSTTVTAAEDITFVNQGETTVLGDLTLEKGLTIETLTGTGTRVLGVTSTGDVTTTTVNTTPQEQIPDWSSTSGYSNEAVVNYLGEIFKLIDGRSVSGVTGDVGTDIPILGLISYSATGNGIRLTLNLVNDHTIDTTQTYRFSINDGIRQFIVSTAGSNPTLTTTSGSGRRIHLTIVENGATASGVTLEEGFLPTVLPIGSFTTINGTFVSFGGSAAPNQEPLLDRDNWERIGHSPFDNNRFSAARGNGFSFDTVPDNTMAVNSDLSDRVNRTRQVAIETSTYRLGAPSQFEQILTSEGRPTGIQQATLPEDVATRLLSGLRGTPSVNPYFRASANSFVGFAILRLDPAQITPGAVTYTGTHNISFKATGVFTDATDLVIGLDSTTPLLSVAVQGITDVQITELIVSPVGTFPSLTAQDLAGTGVRNVQADASGNLVIQAGGSTYTDADARDAVNIRVSSGSLVFNNASDTEVTYTPAGGGDVTQAGANTFTGINTFEGDVIFDHQITIPHDSSTLTGNIVRSHPIGFLNDTVPGMLFSQAAIRAETLDTSVDQRARLTFRVNTGTGLDSFEEAVQIVGDDLVVPSLGDQIWTQSVAVLEDGTLSVANAPIPFDDAIIPNNEAVLTESLFSSYITQFANGGKVLFGHQIYRYIGVDTADAFNQLPVSARRNLNFHPFGIYWQTDEEYADAQSELKLIEAERYADAQDRLVEARANEHAAILVDNLRHELEDTNSLVIDGSLHYNPRWSVSNARAYGAGLYGLGYDINIPFRAVPILNSRQTVPSGGLDFSNFVVSRNIIGQTGGILRNDLAAINNGEIRISPTDTAISPTTWAEITRLSLANDVAASLGIPNITGGTIILSSGPGSYHEYRITNIINVTTPFNLTQLILSSKTGGEGAPPDTSSGTHAISVYLAVHTTNTPFARSLTAQEDRRTAYYFHINRQQGSNVFTGSCVAIGGGGNRLVFGTPPFIRHNQFGDTQDVAFRQALLGGFPEGSLLCAPSGFNQTYHTRLPGDTGYGDEGSYVYQITSAFGSYPSIDSRLRGIEIGASPNINADFTRGVVAGGTGLGIAIDDDNRVSLEPRYGEYMLDSFTINNVNGQANIEGTMHGESQDTYSGIVAIFATPTATTSLAIPEERDRIAVVPVKQHPSSLLNLELGAGIAQNYYLPNLPQTTRGILEDPNYTTSITPSDRDTNAVGPIYIQLPYPALEGDTINSGAIAAAERKYWFVVNSYSSGNDDFFINTNIANISRVDMVDGGIQDSSATITDLERWAPDVTGHFSTITTRGNTLATHPGSYVGNDGVVELGIDDIFPAHQWRGATSTLNTSLFNRGARSTMYFGSIVRGGSGAYYMVTPLFVRNAGTETASWIRRAGQPTVNIDDTLGGRFTTPVSGSDRNIQISQIPDIAFLLQDSGVPASGQGLSRANIAELMDRAFELNFQLTNISGVTDPAQVNYEIMSLIAEYNPDDLFNTRPNEARLFYTPLGNNLDLSDFPQYRTSRDINNFVIYDHELRGRTADATSIRGTDVSTTVPTDGQVLTFNSTAGQWQPSPAVSLVGTENERLYNLVKSVGTFQNPPTLAIPLTAGIIRGTSAIVNQLDTTTIHKTFNGVEYYIRHSVSGTSNTFDLVTVAAPTVSLNTHVINL